MTRYVKDNFGFYVTFGSLCTVAGIIYGFYEFFAGLFGLEYGLEKVPKFKKRFH